MGIHLNVYEQLSKINWVVILGNFLTILTLFLNKILEKQEKHEYLSPSVVMHGSGVME